MTEPMGDRRAIIVGGGFAGLETARRLGGAPAHVTVVDRRNHHLFQPLLYQVATAALAPGDIAEPILRRHPNTDVLLAEAKRVDTGARQLVLVDGERLDYGWSEPDRPAWSSRVRSRTSAAGPSPTTFATSTPGPPAWCSWRPPIASSACSTRPYRIDAGTVLWAAGVQASPLGRSLGADLDKAGRVIVAPDLSVPGHPEAFVIGDQAHVIADDGRPVPGLAPAAIQMGRHVARAILADVTGRPRPRFRYADRGSMATIGRSRAVAQIGRVRLSGVVAWLLCVFVHLMTLVTFRNRVVVFVKWAWAWATFDRSSRLVWQTEPAPPPLDPHPTRPDPQ